MHLLIPLFLTIDKNQYLLNLFYVVINIILLLLLLNYKYFPKAMGFVLNQESIMNRNVNYVSIICLIVNCVGTDFESHTILFLASVGYCRRRYFPYRIGKVL